MTHKNMLTTKQAAEYLGLSRSTMYRREKDGSLLPDVVDSMTNYRFYSLTTLEQYKHQRYGMCREDSVRYVSFPFTFADLFSGIGGIRTGFEQAGGRCVFSSEIDKSCRQTYKHIFGEEPEGDITKIRVEDIPQHNILVAGFPCQPFSIAGVSKSNSLGREHGFRDSVKGTLFFDIVRILEYHRPKAFFLENVKNLKSHDKGKTWNVIQQTLEELGYTVYSRVMDARFVVPQHRERIFIVGFRDPVHFEFPTIEDQKPKLRDILQEEVPDRYTLSDHLWKYLQEYAEKHRLKGNGFGYGLADPDGISRTLSARYHKDGSEILIPQEGKNPRRLTPAECSRLQGFPKKYEKTVVSDTQAYRQFGNAVAVPLVALVAREMVEALARHEAMKHTEREAAAAHSD